MQVDWPESTFCSYNSEKHVLVKKSREFRQLCVIDVGHPICGGEHWEHMVTASLLESWLITGKTWCQVRFLLCIYPCYHSGLWVCSGSHLKFGRLALKRQNHKSGLSICYRYSKLNFILKNYKMLYAWISWRFAMDIGMLESQRSTVWISVGERL